MAVASIILICFRRRNKSTPRNTTPKSKASYAKLQKPRPDFKDKSSKRTSMSSSTTISQHVDHDLEAQTQEAEKSSIYDPYDATSTYSPSQLSHNERITQPQTSAQPHYSSISRNLSTSSHYSYSRHLSEYNNIINTELQTLISEEQETSPLQKSSKEDHPLRSHPQPQQPLLSSNCSSGPAPSPAIYTPPVPRKSSKRMSAPTSIAERLYTSTAA